MTTLSRELSKKIYELVGEYETEKYWVKTMVRDIWKIQKSRHLFGSDIPAPNFAELIRILPKIGKKKGWGMSQWKHPNDVTQICNSASLRFMNAPTEPEGMAAVEGYLMKLI